MEMIKILRLCGKWRHYHNVSMKKIETSVPTNTYKWVFQPALSEVSLNLVHSFSRQNQPKTRPRA